ncbi:hypothetical protein [Treponema lecithinolyticum]
MGLSATAVSRVCGVNVEYKNYNTGTAAMLPQRLAIIGQGNDDAVFSAEKFEIEGSANAVGDKYGYGSPLHLAALQLFPQNGKSADFPVTIYPLAKAASAVAAKGAIGVTVAKPSEGATANGSGTVYVGGIAAEFAIKKGDGTQAILAAVKTAVDSVLNMPAKTGDAEADEIPLTAKWSGESSSMITLEVVADIPGVTFSLKKFAGGAIDPDVNTALGKIGVVWETFVLDCFDYKKEARLDVYQAFGENRWSALEKKPLLVCHGCTDALAERTKVTDARKNDAINFLVVSVGTREMPFVVAARALVNDIVTTANSNPAQGYKGLLTGLHCGADDVQENYIQRSASVNKGSSTNIKNGNVAELNDIVTFYHPANEGQFPSKRYVVDLVKLQNVVFNVRLIMEADNLKGAPLVSDTTITDNKKAVQPKTIKTSFINLADSLAMQAIIQEPEFSKKNMKVEIDKNNPKRVNVQFPVKLSGNVEISDSDIYFGFYLGE